MCVCVGGGGQLVGRGCWVCWFPFVGWVAPFPGPVGEVGGPTGFGKTTVTIENSTCFKLLQF